MPEYLWPEGVEEVVIPLTLSWKAHHTIGADTTHVDGHIGPLNLDVIARGDREVSRLQYWSSQAKWVQGKVLQLGSAFFGAPTLVVPFPTVTTENITEALRRFFA